MPTYNFINTETGEEIEMFMKWSERVVFLEKNPHIEPIVTAPAIVSGSGGSPDQKAGDGWKEVLSKVAEKHPSSTVGQRYGKKSIKEVKNEQIVKKHVDRVTKRLQNKR